MKKILISLINFVLDPLAFIRVLHYWKSNTPNVSFKRMQLVLLTANITLFGMGHRQKVLQSILMISIFETDHIMDSAPLQVQNESQNIALSKIKASLFKRMGTHKLQLEPAYDDFVSFSAKHNNLPHNTKFEDYLLIASISIGVPCGAMLVSILSKQPIRNNYLVLSSEIVRIANDIATSTKDKEENHLNSMDLVEPKKLKSILKKKIALFLSIVPDNKAEKYLYRLVKMSSLFYKDNKDFEL